MKRSLKFALLIAGYFLVAFAQPAWVPYFGPLAATLGYALFWRALIEWQRPVHRFFIATLWFALAQAVQLSWMTATEYMGPMILLVYAGLLLCMGLQFAVLSWLVQRLSTSFHFLAAAGVAGSWVLLEWVRLFACTGFTWNPVGLALSASTLSLQAASLFGIFGLSFWVIFVNLAALRALMLRTRSAALTWAAFAVLPFGYGAVQQMAVAQNGETLSVLLVQTGLLPHEKDYDPSRPHGFVSPWQQWKNALDYLEEGARESVDLIVFPEGAFPHSAYRTVYPFDTFREVWIERYGPESTGDFPPLGNRSSRLVKIGNQMQWYVSNAYWSQSIANHYGSEVVIGLDDKNTQDGKSYNAAFHFLPGKASAAARYEKRVLVPIVEYIPLKGWRFLSQFILNEYGISDSFESGKEATVFSGRVPMGISICYEETYGEMMRQSRLRGAELLVNVTNDAWFPGSRLSRQHFDHGIIRAVENGVPSIRACNTGVTGGVDCFGRIVKVSPESQSGALHLKIPLQTFPTLYSLWGSSAILLLSALFSLGGCLRFFFSSPSVEGSCPK